MLITNCNIKIEKSTKHIRKIIRHANIRLSL